MASGAVERTLDDRLRVEQKTKIRPLSYARQEAPDFHPVSYLVDEEEEFQEEVA